MCGLRCLGCVRPSAVGRTRSRPSEYMYRAVVLWNAIPHANEPVMMNQLSASFRNSLPNCLRRDEEEVGRLVLGDERCLVRAVVAGDRRPRRDRVEDPQADHRDVHRPRHDLLRVLRLLAVVRRHLEADPRPEGEEDADPGRAGGDCSAAASARAEALERVDRVDRGEPGRCCRRGRRRPPSKTSSSTISQISATPRIRAEMWTSKYASTEIRTIMNRGRPVPRDVVAVLGQLQVGEVGEPADERHLEHRVRDDHREAGSPCRARARGRG